MAPAESARQMHEALRDFLAGPAHRPPRVAHADDPTLFVGPNRDDEQPSNFDTNIREIKVVEIADIKHVGTSANPRTPAV